MHRTFLPNWRLFGVLANKYESIVRLMVDNDWEHLVGGMDDTHESPWGSGK